MTGAEQLVGDYAEAPEAFTGRGRVQIYGEDWKAVSTLPVAAGQRVRIERVAGLTLHVVPEE